MRIPTVFNRLLGLTAIGLLTFSGCSSGEGVPIGPQGTTTTDPAAQSLAAHGDTLTSDEAYHLLRRAAFGASPAQVAKVVEEGLNATVDELLRKKPVPGGVTTKEYYYEDRIPQRWLVHMIEGPNPLHEQMALFWHDRFAASRRVLGGRDRNLAVLHWELLRRNALGNYRTFLQELTIDPLMLIWLDGANSPKDHPNANYAREFWEMYTLGRDVLYTEADIDEAARAFTGISLLRESEMDARPIYDILMHDEGMKVIFPGRAPAANHDYLSVIDLTLAQPEAAQYVARNLFKFFVHDNPSNGVVQELANLFAASDFEIKPLVRKILTSNAMFSDDARGNQITSPVQHIVGVARTLDMHITSEDSEGYVINNLVSDLRFAGQDMLNPPAVNGWGENEAWLKDQWIVSRIVALQRTMEYGPERTPGLPYHLLPSKGTWDQREIRDVIISNMAAVFHLQLTDGEREIYKEVLDQNGWRALHLVEPENQPAHVFEMIRLMCMHEDVIGR